MSSFDQVHEQYRTDTRTVLRYKNVWLALPAATMAQRVALFCSEVYRSRPLRRKSIY
jgi:hypothetical protein